MGYIRDNVDAFMAEGHSYASAKNEAAFFERGGDNIDHGYCNPRKAKQGAEDEAILRKQIEDEKS